MACLALRRPLLPDGIAAHFPQPQRGPSTWWITLRVLSIEALLPAAGRSRQSVRARRQLLVPGQHAEHSGFRARAVGHRCAGRVERCGRPLAGP